MIKLIKGMEYWRKHGKIKHRLWMTRIKEAIDDPILIDLIKEAEKEFYSKK